MSAIPAADGRRLRGERTRADVIEAMIELLGEQDGPLTSSAIAERAGVTQRTLFRHFASLDDVYAELIAHQRALFLTFLRPIDPTGSIDERIDLLVANRTTLYAGIAPVRRAALRVSGQHPEVAGSLELAAASLRHQVASLFAAELSPLRGRRRRVGVALLDTASSWEVWDRLVTEAGLDEPGATTAMTTLLHGAASPLMS